MAHGEEHTEVLKVGTNGETEQELHRFHSRTADIRVSPYASL